MFFFKYEKKNIHKVSFLDFFEKNVTLPQKTPTETPATEAEIPVQQPTVTEQTSTDTRTINTNGTESKQKSGQQQQANNNLDGQTTQTTQKVPVCIHYRTSRCRHGISGQNCPYQHPKPCNKYLAFGDKQPRGCQNGSKYQYFHPKLCRDSLNQNNCYNENCKFLHIKGTQRKKPSGYQDIPKNVAPNQQQLVYHTPVQSVAQPVTMPMLPTQPFTGIAQQQQPVIIPVSGPTQQPQTATNDSFLVMLQQIQNKLLQIEKTQQGQSSLIQNIMGQNPTNYQVPPTANQPPTGNTWAGHLFTQPT